MQCSVFENDENIAGWKASSLVAYCESCFQEKMTTEMNLGEMEGNDQEGISQIKQVEGKAKR